MLDHYPTFDLTHFLSLNTRSRRAELCLNFFLTLLPTVISSDSEGTEMLDKETATRLIRDAHQLADDEGTLQAELEELDDRRQKIAGQMHAVQQTRHHMLKLASEIFDSLGEIFPRDARIGLMEVVSGSSAPTAEEAVLRAMASDPERIWKSAEIVRKAKSFNPDLADSTLRAKVSRLGIVDNNAVQKIGFGRYRIDRAVARRYGA